MEGNWFFTIVPRIRRIHNPIVIIHLEFADNIALITNNSTQARKIDFVEDLKSGCLDQII